ncbi:MAG: RNA polymerase sigma factor [Salibacteraceae bacterium]|nr:RNA polymerase sigma factor [Salibacteraceae bacterium]MDP4686228.1 RNA polymerase sigma factor [Salibacteraceae bacterium]MDP4763286.1 RNA polymerase sigma factor [Salibacteraceae bacterium]MDP4843997.1 RNA polymerase sigma factor [Salibacteraceae bacterium]MDP4935542.1 RNA polymerase sigma factor [Salibacteraceae bacterium]
MSSDFYTSSILPHASIIIKICRAYAHSQEDFEDYYQEVCLQIWKSRNNFKQQSEWTTWIYRIALNVCLTQTNKASKRNESASETLISFEWDQNHAFKDETLNLLYGAIKRLNEIDRAVILLYLEEHTYEEIATIIGANQNSIGVRISRIKTRLKTLLDGTIN